MVWCVRNEAFRASMMAIGCGEMVKTNEVSEHESECKEQHLQLAMDTVLRLVQQVKTLQDEVEKIEKVVNPLY